MTKVFANIISIVFHPFLVPTYMLLLLLLINPYLFGVQHYSQSTKFILAVFFSSFLIPGFAVAMMKFLGLIKSLKMEEKTDRIGPYIIAGIFYLWLFLNFRNNPNVPLAYSIFMFGAAISVMVAFIMNLVFKVSMHAIGMGGIVGMVLITKMYFSYGSFTVNLWSTVGVSISMSTLFMISLLVTGLVCSMRLVLKAHKLDEIYVGLAVGLITQFIALKALY